MQNAPVKSANLPFLDIPPGKKKKIDVVDLCAGFYWASIFLGDYVYDINRTASSNSSIFSFGSVLFGYDSSYLLYFSSCFVAMAVVFFLSRRLVSLTAQRAIASVAILCLIIALSPTWNLPLSENAIVAFAMIARGVGLACYIALWGFYFASLDKREAERRTLNTFLLSVFIFLAVTACVQSAIVIAYIREFMMIVSIIPVLTGKRFIELEQRSSSNPNNIKTRRTFYATRVLLGVCAGTALFLTSNLTTSSSQNFTPAVPAIVVIAAIAIYLWHTRDSEVVNTSLLRLTPLAGCGMLLVASLGSTDLVNALFALSFNVVWICWSILHSVQVSAIKEALGLDDTVIASSEKLVFILATLLTSIALACVPSLTTLLGANPQLAYEGLLTAVFLALFVSSYQLGRVIDTKETARILDNAHELAEQQREPVYEQLGERYGLTTREMDVLRLLAKGYGRPAICEDLCISDGTARTHIRHIYKKMDIHSRDELLALIEGEFREQAAK